MCKSAAIALFTGVYPMPIGILQDAILEAINAQRSPDDQLSWAEYEMMLAEEKLRSAAVRQLEKESQVKAEQTSLVSVKAIEAAIFTKILELSRRRWHAKLWPARWLTFAFTAGSGRFLQPIPKPAQSQTRGDTRKEKAGRSR